jgi:hypothetical protein
MGGGVVMDTPHHLSNTSWYNIGILLTKFVFHKLMY